MRSSTLSIIFSFRLTLAFAPISADSFSHTPAQMQVVSFQWLAASCSLFALFSALLPFVFNSLQPLFAKQGGGVSPTPTMWMMLDRRSVPIFTAALASMI
jgi:hypothetical protein